MYAAAEAAPAWKINGSPVRQSSTRNAVQISSPVRVHRFVGASA
jgi:hypothetical protein